MGYAGGLGPENINEQLYRISSVAKGPIWIDMETRVRSQYDLDFDKVTDVLQKFTQRGIDMNTDAIKQVLNSAVNRGIYPITALTARESEVLNYMLTGETASITAERLGLSNRTIELHRSRILKKYKAESIAKLFALFTGIINAAA